MLGGAVGAHACRRLRGLVPALGPDRPDRQDRLAEAVRRAGHLRRGAAQGRHAELEGRSSRSTRTRTRRSSSSATWPWSATCTTIVPQLTELLRAAQRRRRWPRPADYPPPFRPATSSAEPDRPARRAHRGRRAGGRGRTGRAGLRDPVRPAARGGPRDGRTARRGAARRASRRASSRAPICCRGRS